MKDECTIAEEIEFIKLSIRLEQDPEKRDRLIKQLEELEYIQEEN